MVKVPGKRRGRPRKVVPDAEGVRESTSAPVVADRVGEDGRGHPEDACGPSDWPGLCSVLSGIECLVRPLTVCRITVPFECQETWTGIYSGAPVDRGNWKVLLNNGTTISP